MKIEELYEHYLIEADNDPTIDPNASAQKLVSNPVQLPENSSIDNSNSDISEFEPLIKSAKDIPHSKDRAEVLKIAAQIRNIEAKTKETLAKAEQVPDDMMGDDMSQGGMIDPSTGMPMDPSQMGGIDPNTGMPLDMNNQEDDPLKGLGDNSAPQNPLAMGGGIDPMTGMPTNDAPVAYTALGRSFKLKKIYEILDSISKVLHVSSDPKFQPLCKQVDEAFELFRLVVNNLKVYKEKVDEIIVLYYALLKDICADIESIYKERKLDVSLTENRIFKRLLKECKERGF